MIDKIICTFGLFVLIWFLTYSCVQVIANQDEQFDLSSTKPVKLYTDCEYDKSIGINVSKELCEVK